MFAVCLGTVNKSVVRFCGYTVRPIGSTIRSVTAELLVKSGTGWSRIATATTAATDGATVSYCFIFCLPRDAMHSALKRLQVVCPSVRDIAVCFSHSSEYFENNFTAE